MNPKNITKEEKKNALMQQIWELRMYIYLWRFMFGNESSPEKVKEFADYFTDRVLYIFQESLQTKILVDLRTLIDKKKNVISIFRIVQNDKLKSLENVYKNLLIFINNCITHKNEKRFNLTYKFEEVWATIEELQKIIEEDNNDTQIIWDSENLVKDEFISFYEKVKQVNSLEKLNKII